MSSRVRFLVGCIATLSLVGLLGWMWQRSLLPDTYSVAAMGRIDYGVDGRGKRIEAPKAPLQHAQDTSVADLTEHPGREADVVADLTAQAGLLPIAGQQVDGFALNGRTPGPAIVARKGDVIEVRLHNRNVEDGVTLHWHGIDVPAAEDGLPGVTQDAVLPGRSHTYRFVADKAGTYWYHSHQKPHQQARRGLFGSIVILPRSGPGQKHDLTAVAHTYDESRTLNGKTGDLHQEAQAGDTVRVRVINTDDVDLATWSSVPFTIAAIDGYDLQRPAAIRNQHLDIPGGGRADLVLTVPKSGAARVQVGATTAYVIGPRTSYPDRPARPTRAVNLSSYGSGEADLPEPNRVFDYSIGRRPGFIDGRPGIWWTINGGLHPNTPVFMVREGDVVKIRIDNHSGASHSVHLHGHHALVAARNGKPVTGGPVWIDSIAVKNGETVDLVFRADNPGIWMTHSHDPRRANEGLVAHVWYEGVATPYEVGGKAGNAPE